MKHPTHRAQNVLSNVGSSKSKNTPSPAVRRVEAGLKKPSKPPRRAVRKSDLSPARRVLVERMQQLGYGLIKHLPVARGEPVMDPPPRMYRHERLTGPNKVRSESGLEDFLLKRRVVNLFEAMEDLGSGVIVSLEVRDGLPYGMTFEERGRR